MERKAQMKVSNVFILLILCTGILLGAGLIINDFHQSYVMTNITTPIGDYNSTQLAGYGPSVSKLNETINPLEKKLDEIAEEERGFLKLTGILEVFPMIFITGLKLIPDFFAMIRSGFYSIGQTIIPITIIVLALMALLVWFLFKVIEGMRRYPA